MAHQCPLEDRHKFEKITKLVEENILFKLSYAFFSPRSIYFCKKNSFIAILGTLKLKIKITDVSVSGHVFSHQYHTMPHSGSKLAGIIHPDFLLENKLFQHFNKIEIKLVSSIIRHVKGIQKILC